MCFAGFYRLSSNLSILYGLSAVFRVAAGTAHGFGTVDFVQRRVIYAKCTLNPAGLPILYCILVSVVVSDKLSIECM